MLKDWKKERTEKPHSLFGKKIEPIGLYRNKKNKYQIVSISKVTTFPRVGGLNKKSILYMVEYGFNIKHFKTKSKALKYTRAYMRKN